MTEEARKTWASTFPNAWNSDLYNALSDALSTPAVQGQRKEMNEGGETYAFFFFFEETKLYAKVNLLPSGKVIIIYSAHLPAHGDNL